MSCSGAVVRVKIDAGTSFRVQSNSSQFSLLNNAFANRIQHEIEMKAEPVKVNKIVWVILAMMFGCCGCDRCFMGQILLGTLKCLTLGGFMVWTCIDYLVCVVSALQKSERIDMFGYHHAFEKNSIEGAFYAAAIVLLLHIIGQCNNLKNFNAQMQLQKELQEHADANGNSEQKDSSASLDIPRHHQSLAYIPTSLTAGLRKAGIVTEKPTTPELLALFAKMDKDGDGQLDREEVKEGLSAMGVSDEDADAMIKSADTDGDGKISKNEWLINFHQNEAK